MAHHHHSTGHKIDFENVDIITQEKKLLEKTGYKYLTAGPDLSRAYFGVYKNKLHKLFNMKCYPTHVLVLLFRQHCIIYKFGIYSGTSHSVGAWRTVVPWYTIYSMRSHKAQRQPLRFFLVRTTRQQTTTQIHIPHP